jgi:hypothetical protein
LTRISFIVVGYLVAIISLNLAWEHQTILTQMVTIKEYYNFAAEAPFVYRILPALICRVLFWGHANVATGLNAPIDSYFSIFQLALDSIALVIAFVFMTKIARQLNPKLPDTIILPFVATVALLIIVFGYFMVPNKALFYPYDFPDMCIATIIFYLCLRPGAATTILLPIAVLLATLNKETAVFYSGLYLIFSIERRSDWKRVTAVLLASGVAFIVARTFVLFLVHRLAPGSTAQGPQFLLQLLYTLQQMRNPLLLFTLLNICSYLYVPVWAIRKRLDRTDLLILAMVVAWIIIMALVGIFRQLRLYVPASLLLFVILSRHLSEMVNASIPSLALANSQAKRNGVQSMDS